MRGAPAVVAAAAVLLWIPGLAAQAAPAAPPLPAELDPAAAVARALAVHPEVGAARAAVRAADAATGEAKASRLPSLATTASVTRFQEPMVVAPLHGFDPTAPPAFDPTLEQGRLTAAWTLFDGGGRGARIRAAEAGGAAAGAGQDAARMDVIEQTLDAYLGLLSARDVLAAQRARETALDAERDRAARQVQEGSAPRLALLRAQAERSAARAEGEAARARVDLAATALARVLGVPGAGMRERPLADVDADSAAPPDTTVSPDHPLLRQGRARVAAAEAAARQAKAAWLPRVSGQGALVRYDAPGVEGTTEWQAGLQLEYPLFTGGARSGAVARAGAEADRAREELRSTELAVQGAVDQARAALSEAKAREAALGDAVAQYEELVRVEELALSEGAGVQSERLDAEAGLFHARAGLAQARRDRVRARVALARALGRLDESWIAENLEWTP